MARWRINGGALVHGMTVVTRTLMKGEIASHPLQHFRRATETTHGWECEKRQRRLTRSGRYDLTLAAHREHPDRLRPAAALS